MSSSSSLEQYFANLIHASGASEFVLESDNASTGSPPNSSRRRQQRSTSRKQRRLNAGPPNCPLRQVSQDNLNSHGDSSSLEPTLHDFYNEVAPGLLLRRRQQQQMNKMSAQSKKCLSPPPGEGSVRRLLMPSVLVEALNPKTQDRATNLDQTQHKRVTNEDSHKSIYDYLDEVQQVVSGSSPTTTTTTSVTANGGDRRWSGSHILPFSLSARRQFYNGSGGTRGDRRWSGSHVPPTSSFATDTNMVASNYIQPNSDLLA